VEKNTEQPLKEYRFQNGALAVKVVATCDVCKKRNEVREGESEGTWVISFKNKTIHVCHAHIYQVIRAEEIEHFKGNDIFEGMFKR
jgi:hypothetical protein